MQEGQTYDSMMPLIRLLKVFSLNCKVKEKSFNSTFSYLRIAVTALLLGCLNFSSLYYKINNVYTHTEISITITDFVQIVYDYCQYVVDLYFMQKYGGYISMEYFKQFKCIDNILNVTCYSMMRMSLIKRMVFFFIIWFLSSAFDMGAWALVYGWKTPVNHSISYLFLFIKMLTMLDLIAHVIQIEIRLRIVGDMTQSCYSSIDPGPNVVTADCITNKKWLNTKTGIINHVIRVNCSDGKVVKSLTSCYLLLTEQVTFINKMYGFRILLNSLSLLSDMVKLLNLAVRIVLRSKSKTDNISYFPVISSLFRMLTCAAIFITLVDQCESAYRDRERIVNIMDHLLINKNPGDDLRTAVVCFRGLIQDRPVVFNMANFFELNYSFLVSLTSVVVTYTIILLQSAN